MSTIFGETTSFPLTRLSPAGLALPQWNSWWAVAPLRLLRLWAERRSQRRTLGELADERHLLDDNGLSRAQALREAAKPFWRAGQGSKNMFRSWMLGLLAGGIGLIGAAHAGTDVCKPSLAVTDVGFSAMRPPTLERKWTAVVSVDASQCATTTGNFEIMFSRLKENGLEVDFHETFKWQPPAVNVTVDFWADEAVERYWLNNVAACPCRR